MKTFEKTAAQGDVYFIRTIDDCPLDGVRVHPDKEYLIVAHSENGHHHVMMLDSLGGTPNVELYKSPDPHQALLKVRRPTELRHLRSFDMHEEILFAPGVYFVHYQQEYTPQGYRRVVD